MTRYQDLNLTGAGSSSGHHSGRLHQSGTEPNSLCARPGRLVNVYRKFYIIVCNHLSFALGRISPYPIQTNKQENERERRRA